VNVESAPTKAHRPRKRRTKPGKLPDLVRVVWQALIEAESVLQRTNGDNPELALKAVHAISQAAGMYVRLLETSDFERRLQALEAKGGTPR
jgi:hypothetical protein